MALSPTFEHCSIRVGTAGWQTSLFSSGSRAKSPSYSEMKAQERLKTKFERFGMKLLGTMRKKLICDALITQRPVKRGEGLECSQLASMTVSCGLNWFEVRIQRIAWCKWHPFAWSVTESMLRKVFHSYKVVWAVHPETRAWQEHLSIWTLLIPHWTPWKPKIEKVSSCKRVW